MVENTDHLIAQKRLFRRTVDAWADSYDSHHILPCRYWLKTFGLKAIRAKGHDRAITGFTLNVSKRWLCEVPLSSSSTKQVGQVFNYSESVKNFFKSIADEFPAKAFWLSRVEESPVGNYFEIEISLLPSWPEDKSHQKKTQQSESITFPVELLQVGGRW